MKKSILKFRQLQKIVILLTVIFLVIAGTIIGLTFRQSKIANETYRERMDRCGDFPYEDGVPSGSFGYVVISNVLWSPDCNYIAWSVYNSGTVVLNPDGETGVGVKGEGEEGVFLYSIETKEIKKIPLHTPYSNFAGFLGWKDNKNLIISFEKNDIETEILFNISTNQISSE